MELKSLEDWVVEKNFKSVPNVVDVASFGGPTREYQVRVDPDKLISYGLSIGQVEQQLTNNNANARRQLHRSRPAADQHPGSGPGQECPGHREHRHHDQERHAAAREGYRGGRAGPEDPAGPVRARRFATKTERSSITTTWSRASCCCAKGADADAALQGIHDKVKELNDHILPAGVKVVPFIDRSDLVHFTTHTVLHNLTEGIILVVIILFLFLGNVRGAIIVALTIPFSLLFAATCLNLKGIPANLLSLGALDFGMVVDGAVVMVENIVRHLEPPRSGRPDRRNRRSSTPRTKSSGRCFTPSPSSSPPTCRSSRCSAWKGDCSSPWPGPWRSLCWAP